jgi:hypothetical protein
MILPEGSHPGTHPAEVLENLFSGVAGPQALPLWRQRFEIAEAVQYAAPKRS